MIAVRRARRGIDESLDARVTRADQHVEKAGRVCRVRTQRVLDRPRNRPERGLVQHDVDVRAGGAACIGIDDVGLDEPVALPLFDTDGGTNFLEIAPVPCCEVVETDDVLVEVQQRLGKMRPDEAGAASDEPSERPRAERTAGSRERPGPHRRCCHQSLQTSMPRARSAASAWLFTSTYRPLRSRPAT